MAESANRPVAAKLYQTPPASDTRPGSEYTPPGRPAAREPEAGNLVTRRNSGAHTTEPVGAPPRAVRKADPVQSHPEGASVVHRTSGQRGTVVGHRAHGLGTALPLVEWKGEEASWPTGVAASALRVVGSHPDDLYQYNEDATSGRPARGSTGAA